MSLAAWLDASDPRTHRACEALVASACPQFAGVPDMAKAHTDGLSPFAHELASELLERWARAAAAAVGRAAAADEDASAWLRIWNFLAGGTEDSSGQAFDAVVDLIG
jgi:hypothetical protein